MPIVRVYWLVEDSYVNNGEHMVEIDLDDYEYEQYKELDFYEKVDFLSDWIQEDFEANVSWEVKEIEDDSDDEDDDE